MMNERATYSQSFEIFWSLTIMIRHERRSVYFPSRPKGMGMIVIMYREFPVGRLKGVMRHNFAPTIKYLPETTF